MRISDWSSDVCSSDLLPYWRVSFISTTRLSSAVQFGCGTNPFAGLLLISPRAACGMRKEGIRDESLSKTSGHRCYGRNAADGCMHDNPGNRQSAPFQEIGRASCRERVCQSV